MNDSWNMEELLTKLREETTTNNPTDKHELLANIHTGWLAWEALLAEVGSERMEVPGPGGGGAWSAKDLIAHVMESEKWTAHELRLAHGEQLPANPDNTNPAMFDIPKRSEIVFQRNRDRSLTDIQAESHAVHDGLIAVIEQMSDEELGSTVWWSMGKPVLNVIPSSTYKHYEELTPDVRAWLDEQS